MPIDSAVKAVGELDNKDALRAAIKKADFKSVRGPFKFNSNGFPVQDFYLVKVASVPRILVPDGDRAEDLRGLRRRLCQDCELKSSSSLSPLFSVERVRGLGEHLLRGARLPLPLTPTRSP